MPEKLSLTTDHIYFHHTVSETPTDEYALHCHPYYEVFYLASGDVSYRVEGAEYAPAPGSLLLMRPGVFHGVRILSSRPYDRIAVHFLPGCISEEAASLLLSPFSARGACLSGSGEYRIRDYLDSILCCAQMPSPLQQAALRPRVEALMAQLCLMAQTHGAETAAPQVREPVRGMIDYLNARIREPLSLEELSARFFISKNQLNRIFRQATGTTVISYLAHKRIALARRMLLEGVSAAEAAAQSGFGDYSNFYRTYRRLTGRSPGEARKLPVL